MPPIIRDRELIRRAILSLAVQEGAIPTWSRLMRYFHAIVSKDAFYKTRQALVESGELDLEALDRTRAWPRESKYRE